MSADSGRLERQLSTLEQLLAIDDSDLDVALQRAAQVVTEVLGAEKIDIFVYEAASTSLVARGTSDTPMGRRQHEIGMERLPLAGRGRAVEVFEGGGVYQNNRVDEDPGELIGIREGLGVRSAVVVPLDVGGERRGVVSAVTARPDFFSTGDVDFLEAVARWTGLIMHRTELAQRVLGDAEVRARRELLEQLLKQLTPRQREVATLITSGFTNQQIAEKLVVTPGTVANHVAQLLDRLGVSSRTQVAALVAELGLHHEDGQVSAGRAPQSE